MRYFHTILLSCMILALGQPAEARKRGTESFEVEKIADLPETEIFKYDGQYVNVGFLYKTTSIIVAPVWAEAAVEPFVLYTESSDMISYTEIRDEERKQIITALGSDPTENYRFSPWKYIWGAYLIIALIGYGIISSIFGKKDKDEADK